MGGLFGALLSRVALTTLLDTNRHQVEAINTEGLQISDVVGRNKVYRVPAISSPKQYAAKADLAIVFTKCLNTKAAAQTTALLLKEDGAALTLQNGLGNKEHLIQALGTDRVMAGVTSEAATTLKPGYIKHAGTGITTIGGSSALGSMIQTTAACLREAGLQVQCSDSIDTEIWGKLIINVGINALAAILRVPNGILGITPEAKAIMKQVVTEAVSVATALNIPLPYSQPMHQVLEVCEKTSANRASMLQDILANRVTEIDAINGAIVTLGGKTGIATPANSFITQTIKAMQATVAHRI